MVKTSNYMNKLKINLIFYEKILWGSLREVPERSEGDGVNLEYLYGCDNVIVHAI